MATRRKPQSMYQYEPLVTPSNWKGEERQFVVRLTHLFDQLFARKTSYGTKGDPGPSGSDGATYIPSVSADGTISWTNDGGLENPVAVNIMGPKGDPGDSVLANALTVSILASAWSNSTQIVSSDGVTSDGNACHVIVTPSIDSHSEYVDAGIRCVEQGNGTLTFVAENSPPPVDVSANVLVLR